MGLPASAPSERFYCVRSLSARIKAFLSTKHNIILSSPAARESRVFKLLPPDDQSWLRLGKGNSPAPERFMQAVAGSGDQRVTAA
jgi:hypothetical protein